MNDTALEMLHRRIIILHETSGKQNPQKNYCMQYEHVGQRSVQWYQLESFRSFTIRPGTKLWNVSTFKLKIVFLISLSFNKKIHIHDYPLFARGCSLLLNGSFCTTKLDIQLISVELITAARS